MPQETNMAELLRLMNVMIGKFSDLDVKVDDLGRDMKEVKADVSDLKTNLARVEGKVDLLAGQFRDVAVQAIEDTQRITGLEGRIDILEIKSH